MSRTEIARFLSFRPFTGRHMLFVMCSFFGVVIAVNLFMATMAAKSWTGLIARNGYVATQLMSQREAREAAAVAAGWQLSATMADEGLLVAALDGTGRPIHSAAVVAAVERPVMDKDDRPVTLDAVGAGRYRLVEALAPGRWFLDVTVTADDMELTRRFSFTVDG